MKSLSRRVQAVVLVCALAVFAAPAVGADVFHRYWIRGEIEKTFHRLGGVGFFGDAAGRENVLSDGGRFQVFARGSSIYWHPEVSGGVARQVGGLIRDRWGESGWERGVLGYPVTDELDLVGRDGKFNHFQNGSIYWSEGTGARVVRGPVRDYWQSRGWEQSHLGLPVADQRLVGSEVHQDFEHGRVVVVNQSFDQLVGYQFEPHASYRMVMPIFPADIDADGLSAHMTPSGMLQQVVHNFSDVFPFSGCPQRVVRGSRCVLSTTAGRSEEVTVVSVADDGFVLRTGDASAQGANRDVVFRFVLIPGSYRDEDLVHADPVRQAMFVGLGEQRSWLAVEVYSQGSIRDAKYAGAFNNARLGRAAWSKMTLNMVAHAASTDTVYVTRELPLLEELLELLKLAGTSRSFGEGAVFGDGVVDDGLVDDGLVDDGLVEAVVDDGVMSVFEFDGVASVDADVVADGLVREGM